MTAPKYYSSYVLKDTFGVVAAPYANLEVIDRFCFSPANENINVYDLEKGTLLHKISVHHSSFYSLQAFHKVTQQLALGKNITAGYSDGTIRIWPATTPSQDPITTFLGHRGPITALACSMDHQVLASGGSDHDIIIWDVFLKSARFRLPSAHTQPITALQFLYPLVYENTVSGLRTFKRNAVYLLSGSLDGTMRLWDLESQSCLQTISSHSTGSVHSLMVMPDQRHVLVGLGGRAVEIFSVKEVVLGGLGKSRKRKRNELELSSSITIEYSGHVDRHSASNRVSSLCCVGVDDRSTEDLPEDAGNKIVKLSNGICLGRSEDRFYVPDQKYVILVGSFSKHIDIIISHDRRGQQRRTLRLLIRKVEKLRKKSKKLKKTKQIDKELQDLLGPSWTSSFHGIENKEILKIQESINNIKDLIKYESRPLPKKPSDEDGRVRKKASKDENTRVVQSTSENTDNQETTLDSAAVYFKMLKGRFDVLGRAVSIVAPCPQNIALTTAQNTIELYNLEYDSFFNGDKDEEGFSNSIINRTVIGSSQSLIAPPTFLTLSNDKTTIMTLCTGQCAFWDASQKAILRVFDQSTCQDLTKSFKPLCGTFLPGDDYVLIGDSLGTVNLFHIPTAKRTFSFQGHTSSIVGLSLRQDKAQFVTVGADNVMTLYSLNLSGEDNKVGFKSMKSIDLPCSPTCCKFSKSNGEFIAVGLSNNTCQIHFGDSLKMNLILYGHSLAIKSLDWSEDNSRLITGGLDRHIKVWDSKFGNIVRSIRAHNEGYISNLSYMVPDEPGDKHIIVTLSTGLVQLWDIESGDRISNLIGPPKTNIFGLALSSDGQYIYLASEDRAVKIWERTGEPMFIMEEREKEENAKMLEEAARSDLNLPTSGAADVAVSARPTRKTIEAVRDTERLIEVIEAADEEENNRLGYAAAIKEWEESPFKGTLPKPPKPSPKLELFGRDPRSYVLESLAALTNDNASEVLLGLPVKHASKLIQYMTESLNHFCTHLDNKSQMAPLLVHDAEVAIRIALQLVQVHRKYLSASEHFRPILYKLADSSRKAIDYQSTIIRRNLVAVEFLTRRNL